MTLFDDESRQLLPCDGTARFVPTFLTDAEAQEHFDSLSIETPWEQRDIIIFGRSVPQPRLACWYGEHSYSYSGIRLEPREWTARLETLKELCERASGVRFNSCLVNLYRSGADSMGWHADDEPELGTAPVIASVSLGATRTFRMRHRSTKEIVVLPLNHGSLLVMAGPMQQYWMHEIPKTKRDVGPRINLTFRTIIPH